MSSSVGSPALSHDSSKWKLAQCLAGESSLPEHCLQQIFKGMIDGIDSKSQTKIEASLKEKIWQTISSQRLQAVRNVLISEISNQILGGFNESDAAKALSEHRSTGKVWDVYLSSRIQTAHQLCHESIVASVGNYVISITEELALEIQSLLKAK